MLKRNDMVHSVFWPQKEGGWLQLVDPDGDVVADWPINEPIKGSEVSKMMPEGYGLWAENCVVVSMSGKLVVATVAPFDTAVVTERAEVSFEERMQRLERRERYREKREKKLMEENKAMKEQLEASMAERAEGEVVEEPETTEPVAEAEVAKEEVTNA